jgi:hypothetical protein
MELAEQSSGTNLFPRKRGYPVKTGSGRDLVSARPPILILASRHGAHDASSMRVMALTGGIASGKSTVCRGLREFLPSVVIFDCDTAVHRLLEADPEVAAIVLETFGDQALDGNGRIDRHFLRGRVFADEAARLRLEAILHPRVKQECLDSLADAATRGRVCSSRTFRFSSRRVSTSASIRCSSSRHPAPPKSSGSRPVADSRMS